MHLRAGKLRQKERRNEYIVKLKVKKFSFSYHALHHQSIIDVVTIQEQVVFQFLSHSKHTQLLGSKLLNFSFIFYQFLHPQHFEIGNRTVVFSFKFFISIGSVPHLEHYFLLFGGRFCFEFLRCVVRVICYRVVDQADRHAVIKPGLIDEQRQRVVGHLQIGRQYQCLGRFCVFLAC